MVTEDPRIYRALALPERALASGGTEILRAGLIGDKLYVTARRAFKDPARWGEVLADVTRRLGAIYAAEPQGLSRKDATVQIAEALAAEMGARPARLAAPKPKLHLKKAAKPAARHKKR